MSDDKELIAMARLAQRDDRMSSGALYGDLADRIEALTKQLAAARQDAKFAEDELEMQEQEACMMENDYIKLEKERDDFADQISNLLPAVNREAVEQRQRAEAAEAKLAKAVEALDAAANWADRYRWAAPWVDDARATLVEIKGESHE